MTAMAPPPWGETRAAMVQPSVVVGEHAVATDQPSADVAGFRDAMARLAGGVGVLAVRDPIGRDCGITVTAVSSVSLEPPLVLVCVKRDGFIHDALHVSDSWTLTMLADDQLDLVEYAARSRHPGARDDFTSWAHRTGEVADALVLTGGVSAVECVPHRLVDAGDHTVVIGRVVATAGDMTGERPLVHVDRAYRGPGNELG